MKITKEIIQKCFDSINLPIKIRSARLGDGFFIYSKYAFFEGKEFVSSDEVDGKDMLIQCVCSLATTRNAREVMVNIDRSEFPDEYVVKSNENYNGVKADCLFKVSAILNLNEAIATTN